MASDDRTLQFLYESCIKPKVSLKTIAKKHGVDIGRVEKELAKGTKVEMEHTKDRETAETIASHHLDEMLDYYTKLTKMEESVGGSVFSHDMLFEKDEKRLYNRLVYLPDRQPYGFWMDKHGNFMIVGGMGGHKRLGSMILADLGENFEPTQDGIYDKLFDFGWVRLVTQMGKTYYETGIGKRMTPIQKKNIQFINDFYELGGVEEG